MIPVPRPGLGNEPPLFDRNCREPGAAWLAAHSDLDPHKQCEWWTQFLPDLAKLFSYRCGWLATYIGLQGDVDHWAPCKQRRELAFEWSNYRYCAGTINSLKLASDQILDPCEVEDGWFEVSLPDFQLLPTDLVPDEHKQRARDTLDQLQLRRGDRARWTRWDWYRRYWNGGHPDLISMRRDAPLVAAAVEKAQQSDKALPDPSLLEPVYQVQRRQRRFGTKTRPGKMTE